MMSKRDLKKFEKLLLQERERLLGSIRGIEESSRSAASQHNSGDLASYAESGTDNFDLETALSIAGAESGRLRDIEDALAKIEDGTYGVCEGTGDPIPKKRLEAFPAARYTVEYQSELERQQRGL